MDNRELATFILLGLSFVFVVVKVPLGNVLKALLAPKVAALLLFFAGWIALAVWLAHLFGLWTNDLFASTVLWFLFVGMAWFLHINDASKDADFFKRRVIEAVGIGAMLEFFVNLEVMPLPAELVFQLALIFVVAVDTYARHQPEFKSVARLTTGALVTFTIGLIIFTIVQLVESWHSIQPQDVANDFLLPIWLTLVAVPFLYVIALFAGYESLFLNMKFWNDGHWPALRSVAGVMAELRFSLIDINGFRGVRARTASISGSFAESRQAVHHFKQTRAEEQAARANARARLFQYTGATGVDEDGLVLDRREFAQTKKALRWLATCHQGWYQRDDRIDAYRSDLLKMLGDFADYGLSENHGGIAMKVRKDGQAWYAYRVTPSGHVFGIGADGPPPSEWYYDGPKPPRSFPTANGGWTSFMQPDPQEWREEPPVD
jgi:hypothetical protein